LGCIWLQFALGTTKNGLSSEPLSTPGTTNKVAYHRFSFSLKTGEPPHWTLLSDSLSDIRYPQLGTTALDAVRRILEFLLPPIYCLSYLSVDNLNIARWVVKFYTIDKTQYALLRWMYSSVLPSSSLLRSVAPRQSQNSNCGPFT